MGRAVLPTYKGEAKTPTTTLHPQPVELKRDARLIQFIDTPGLSFVADTEPKSNDILLKNRGRIEKVKDPNPAGAQYCFIHLEMRPLTFIFSAGYIAASAVTEDLMLYYNLPAIPKGDIDAFLKSHAKVTGRIKRVCVSRPHSP
jgi:nuclear GTP-binding protein